MRKISLTNFFLIASFVISMTVNSQSHAQTQPLPGSFAAAVGGGFQGFGSINGSQRINGVVGSSARTTRPAASASQQPAQQQQSSAQSANDGNAGEAEAAGGPVTDTGVSGDSMRIDRSEPPVVDTGVSGDSIRMGRSVDPSAAAEPPPVTDTGVSGDSIRMSRSLPQGATVSKEDACTEAASTARSACLMPGTSGMDEGTAAMFSMMMTVQLPSMVAQMASIGKNMGQQCQVQADISKVMATINGVKGAACATTIGTCKTACTEEATFESEQATTHASNVATEGLVTADKKKMMHAKTAAATCSAYTGQVMGMMMSAMQSGVSAVANGQCASDLAAFNAAVPTFTPPKLVGGCEDPNNQTLACYCTRPGNSTSAMCAGFTGGSLAGGGTTAAPNGSTVAAPYASTAATDTSGNTVDPFADPGAKKPGSEAGGKGQGDGGQGAPGGGGLASLAGEGGGSGAGGDPKSAITGTSGGTGGGLGGAGGGGGGGGGLARNNGGSGNGGGFLDKFNLKRFLPGSKYKTRGIAGMSVKSVDGITGPMGPSLFEKATRQYQEQIQKQTVILEK